ncbi:MAG: antitermination protein NusG [Actinobacteria bacterium]|nr:antitermination protein NusG [Actinomycetota bacterium]
MIAADILTRELLGNFWLRYLHVLAGIAWIGLLYYFNFVQVPGLAAYGDEGKARNITITQIATRALWWFRWAAVATLATGLLIVGVVPNYMKDFLGHEGSTSANAYNAVITVGMVLGITMAANVWMVIWKNQKVVIANAAGVLGGNEPNPDAATAGRRAMLASRQNMIFSVSMLFYMVGAAHYYDGFGWSATSANASTFVLIAVVIGALLQLNALGKFGGIKAGNKTLVIYESHKNAIITSVVLWAVLFVLSIVFMG